MTLFDDDNNNDNNNRTAESTACGGSSTGSGSRWASGRAARLFGRRFGSSSSFNSANAATAEDTHVEAQLLLQSGSLTSGLIGEYNMEDLEGIVKLLEQGLDVKDRRYHLKLYKSCFIGTDAVEFMISNGITANEDDAVLIGRLLVEAGYIAHVLREHDFENKHLFYRFTKHEDHGSPAPNALSWAEFLGKFSDVVAENDFATSLPGTIDSRASVHLDTASQLSPMDEHNLKLLEKVHPAGWQNPEPKLYDLLVIGAGAGGLVSAAGAAGTGAKVALVEEHLLGGDCLNSGCVPSKALLHAASVAAQLRNPSALEEVMEKMRKLRADIADNDSAERFTKKFGVDMYFGRARFISRREVDIDGTTVRFIKSVVATGGSPRLPAIDGLQEAYEKQNWSNPVILTNLTIFNLTSLPESIGIIGAGPIGCELAQAFARFGARVHIFARSGRILTREDPDASGIVEDALRRDGVELTLNVNQYFRASCDETGAELIITTKDGGDTLHTFAFAKLLVAAGRRPNTSNMGLDLAGIEFDDTRGIHVNDKLQTTNDNIYAVGDVCSPVQFTHASDFMARTVIRNSLFFGSAKFSNLIIPWCTYTSPEIAHVGRSQHTLDATGTEYDVYEKHLKENDRAILEYQTEGFVRIICKKKTDKIIGATIVAAHAGDMISEITLAMQTGVGLGQLASVIHPYPTQADAIRACGDLYNRTRLTTTVRMLLRGVIKLQRTGKR